MAETMQSLDQLSTLKPAAPEAPKYVQKLDKQGRAYATGKRKACAGFECECPALRSRQMRGARVIHASRLPGTGKALVAVQA